MWRYYNITYSLASLLLGHDEVAHHGAVLRDQGVDVARLDPPLHEVLEAAVVGEAPRVAGEGQVDLHQAGADVPAELFLVAELLPRLHAEGEDVPSHGPAGASLPEAPER